YLKYATSNEDGYYLASTCDWAIVNSTMPTDYFIEPLDFNTAASEITPTFYRKGIIYAGPGENMNPNTGLPYYDLLYAERKDDSVWVSTSLSSTVNCDLHDASPCYSAD